MLCVWNLSYIAKNVQQLSLPWLTDNKKGITYSWPPSCRSCAAGFLLLYTDDVGSRFFWNDFVFIPDHTASHLGRPPWKRQILHFFFSSQNVLDEFLLNLVSVAYT
jgi:hypothetical protein